MVQQSVARFALGMIIGAVAAVAITQPVSMNAALMRWVVYCVVAGILINPPSGATLLSLVSGGIISSIGLMGALGWIAAIHRGVIPNISAEMLDLVNDTSFAAAILGGLFFASVVGVTVGGLARPVALELIQRAGNTEPTQARNIEAWLRAIAAIAGTGWLLLS